MRARGALYGATAAAIWGGMYVVSKAVLEVIPPFSLLTLRLLLAAALLFAVLRRRGPLRLDWPAARRLLLIGVVGFGISIGGQFVGTDLSTASNGAPVTSAAPAFVVLFAALILGEPLTRLRAGALALASLGVARVVGGDGLDFSSRTFAGNLALTVAAVTWGLYSVLVRQASVRQPTEVITLVAICGGLLFTAPLVPFELRQRAVGEISVGVVLGVLYLGVVSTALAAWLWNRSFALLEAGVASLLFFVQPLVGTTLGAWLQGDPLTPAFLLGALLIAVGVGLCLRPDRPADPSSATADIG